MDMTLVLQQMLILLIMIVIGYIAKKVKIITSEGESTISKLTVNIALPALILHSVFTGPEVEDKSVLSVVFISALAFYLFSFVFSKIVVLIFRVDKSKRGSYECMLGFGNISFMGIPVLRAVFPAQQETAVLYQSIFVIFFHLFIFTYGIYLLARDGKSGKKLNFSAKNFLNMATITSIIAVVLYIFNVRPPEIINSALGSLGGITTPLAMILIGSSLASYPLLNMFKHLRNYGLTLLKLVVIPGIVWIVSKYLIDDFLVRGVLTIISAMPVATLTIMLSNQYGGDKEFIPQGVFMTTVCSVVTIPLATYVLFNF